MRLIAPILAGMVPAIAGFLAGKKFSQSLAVGALAGILTFFSPFQVWFSVTTEAIIFAGAFGSIAIYLIMKSDESPALFPGRCRFYRLGKSGSAGQYPSSRRARNLYPYCLLTMEEEADDCRRCCTDSPAGFVSPHCEEFCRVPYGLSAGSCKDCLSDHLRGFSFVQQAD